MKRIGYSALTALVLATLAVSANMASATPPATGAAINMRVFNDCPGAASSFTNAFPGSIKFNETYDCVGGADLDCWSLSSDGGATPTAYINGDKFTYCATLTVNGTGNGEAGLRLSPWWSPQVDGRFNCRTTDGEVACFGGRLPFYSFTGTYGVHYLKGTSIRLQIDYDPHNVSFLDPATITYTLTYGPNTYSSGPLAFDHGNPAEDPPHGVWGILTPAYAGGHFQVFGGSDPIPTDLSAEFTNICYDAGPTPASNSTWGKIKANYR